MQDAMEVDATTPSAPGSSPPPPRSPELAARLHEEGRHEEEEEGRQGQGDARDHSVVHGDPKHAWGVVPHEGGAIIEAAGHADPLLTTLPRGAAEGAGEGAGGGAEEAPSAPPPSYPPPSHPPASTSASSSLSADVVAMSSSSSSAPPRGSMASFEMGHDHASPPPPPPHTAAADHFEEDDDDDDDGDGADLDLRAAAMAAEVLAQPQDLHHQHHLDTTAATIAARTAAAAPLMLREVTSTTTPLEDDEEEDEDEDEDEDIMRGDAEEEEEEGRRRQATSGGVFDADVPRTKHEIAPTQLVKEDPASWLQPLLIPDDGVLEPAGSVEGIVEGFLVILADTTRPTLDIDSILCFQDRTPLGKVFEVFGPVKKPYYSIIHAHVERLRGEGREALLAKGTPVFFVPSASSFVHPASIYSKGSDASGEHDEEPPEDELEFSDDEQELLYRRQRKQKLKEHRRKTTQEWSENAEMCLRAGAGPVPYSHGRRRGDRGRRWPGNRGAYGGNRSHPATSVASQSGPESGDYMPLQRPAHFVEHVMSNPSYGASSDTLVYPYPPYAASLYPYSASTVPPPMVLPLPNPNQMGYASYPVHPMHLQSSWQNQFYSSTQPPPQ